MASQALTNAELARLREAHAEGMSLNAIALELGRSKSTVSRRSKAFGLDWSKDRTAAATEAKVATARDKRATLEARFLDEAGLLLDQLHQQHTAYNFGGKDNTYAEHTMDEPDIVGKKNLIQAAGTAVDKAMRLADADKATTGAAAGASMVGSLFTALALRAAESEDSEPGQ